jgi:hypothetical protein
VGFGFADALDGGELILQELDDALVGGNQDLDQEVRGGSVCLDRNPGSISEALPGII